MFFSFINLGCSKNLVDTQFLLGNILEKRPDHFFYAVDPFSPEVELVFLNTCGFISSGRKEMLDTIKKLLRKKKKIGLLGCAVQYFEKLTHDAQLNDHETQEWEIIKNNPNIVLLSWETFAHFDPCMLEKQDSPVMTDFIRPKNTRAYTNIDLGYEYLKIAEGCNNHCSFCIIPQIRGKQRSLPLETVVEEAKKLIVNGAKELILIAQDSIRYGIDLYSKPQLFELLEAIDQLEGDFHYRVLYLYPDLLTQQHLKRLVHLKKFIPYFDLPLQHASPKLLKSMGRFYNHEMTLSILKWIKTNFEKSFIRTNFIIGFPGETEEDFQILLDFIKQDRFENIALFEYHDEPLAASSTLPEKIGAATIRARFQQAKALVDKLQQAREKKEEKQEKIGIISDIWADSKGDWGFTVRPLLHCPEIDNEDEISIDQITESLDGKEIAIGGRIRYCLNQ